MVDDWENDKNKTWTGIVSRYEREGLTVCKAYFVPRVPLKLK